MQKAKEVRAASCQTPSGSISKRCHNGTLWCCPPTPDEYWVRLVSDSARHLTEIVLTFISLSLKCVRNWYVSTDYSRLISFAPYLRIISGAQDPLYNILYVREVKEIVWDGNCRRPMSGESGDTTSQD